MIPLIAGMVAAGPIAKMFTEITHTISQPSQPNPAQFNQSLHAAGSSPTQIQINSLLQGRAPNQLNPLEQQQLGNLLVGKTVQIIGSEGQSIQGLVAQSVNTGGSIQIQIQNQPIELNQIAAIQVA